MKVSRVSAVAVLVGGSTSPCGCAAFQFHPSPAQRIGVPSAEKSVHHAARRTPAFAQPPCKSRGCTSSLGMGYSHAEESTQRQRDEEEVESSAHLSSRRAALRQCSSIFAATAFGAATWTSRREAACASSFSDGPEPPLEEAAPPVRDAPPQFADGTVVTPRPPVVQQSESPPSEPSSSVTTVASSSAPPEAKSTQVTLENSQVVQIPVVDSSQSNFMVDNAFSPAAEVEAKDPEQTKAPVNKAFSPAAAAPAAQPHVDPAQTKRKMDGMAELAITMATLAACGKIVLGRLGGENADPLSAKAKVVMIAPDPYGMDVGRRYYNGVDITVNDPVPASDVKEHCDAGQLNPGCTQTIAGFLGDVRTNAVKGTGPSMEQQEAAAAVLSYLTSLNTPAGPPSLQNGGESDTAVAFSSYLNGLSNGEIAAPASPELVADYLSSLNEVQGRMTTLESSVERIPSEVSGRLQEWQEGQDERLAKEFVKIEEHLMSMECGTNANVDDGRGNRVSSVDLNGVVNGGGMGEMWG